MGGSDELDDGEESTGSEGSFLRAIGGIDDEAETAAAPEGARPSGSRFGRFVLRSELGRGGMGIVYRADDEQLGRSVALKVLRETTRTDPQRRARFLREARAAAGLVHRNVAAVYEIGEEAGERFIAMELVPGDSLRQVLMDRGGALPVGEAVTIARGIARALAAAHAKGIVHRDLKPENVMLDAEGEPKVLDFGLAKGLESAPPPQDILERQPTEGISTAEGHLVGTPAYMSPEQAQGKPVDVRSDVFSFGIVLFEMLAGERPFKGDSGMSLAISIARDPPLDLARLRRELPRTLTTLVATCLEKAPADRYPSARELYVALGSVDTADAAAAETARRSRQPRPAKARAKNAAAIGALVAIAAIVAVGALGRQARSSSLAASLAASAASAASDAGVRPRSMTDYPPPPTKNPGAAAAYAAFMQNLRDATGGHADLDLAVKLDPTFAAAYLRAIQPWNVAQGIDVRASFALAQQYRGSLDERELALLGADEAFTHDPVDWDLAASRFRTVLARFPDDIETLSSLGSTLRFGGHVDEAAVVFQRALEIDPHYAMALVGLGNNLRGIDNARAMGFYKQCLEVSPRATNCASNLATMEQDEGQCADYEATARRLVAIDPMAGSWNEILANALAVRGAPLESVGALLDRAAALDSGGDARAGREHRDQKEIAVGALAGDFSPGDRWRARPRASPRDGKQRGRARPARDEGDLEPCRGGARRQGAASGGRLRQALPSLDAGRRRCSVVPHLRQAPRGAR